mmetsp:Transcript_19844/g.25684  ORF Transcript_19844/g.25684 Transcript_19844/m.25684 type:complete len:241 (+) Transcript_19844:51-773(+)
MLRQETLFYSADMPQQCVEDEQLLPETCMSMWLICSALYCYVIHSPPISNLGSIRKRGREALSALGWLGHIGIFSALSLSAEVYLWSMQPHYFDSIAWQLVVGYTGANHILYFIHSLDGQTRAGVGGLLKKNRASAFLLNFAQHRLSDIWVHLGIALQSSLRFDHWLALTLHLIKYSGGTIPEVFKKYRISTRYGSLASDDIIDCFAHSISAFFYLGPQKLALAILLAQFQRSILGSAQE